MKAEEVTVLSSESRKRNKCGCDQHKSPPPDAAKLAMVSDYLKRTLSERPYAFILESLSERLEMGKVEGSLNSVGLIPAPVNFDPKVLNGDNSVAFAPYCCKPFDCPMNEDKGRKCNCCQAVSDKCEHTQCTIGQFIKIAKKFGIKEFYVIDTDTDLIKWLTKKREEGYTYAVGVACEFAVSYAFEVIHGQLGFDGLIVIINGDKCRSKTDYAESDLTDKGRLTFIDEWTLMALEELANHAAEENHAAKANSNGSAATDK